MAFHRTTGRPSPASCGSPRVQPEVIRVEIAATGAAAPVPVAYPREEDDDGSDGQAGAALAARPAPPPRAAAALRGFPDPRPRAWLALCGLVRRATMELGAAYP